MTGFLPPRSSVELARQSPSLVLPWVLAAGHQGKALSWTLCWRQTLALDFALAETWGLEARKGYRSENGQNRTCLNTN